jgi:hypothetical protein
VVETTILMFTINRYTEKRVIVVTSKNEPIPLPTLQIIMAADKVIQEHHVCILLANNHELVMNINLFYGKSAVLEGSLPYAWRKVYGVILGSNDQAERVVEELDKLLVWKLLKQ